MAGGAGATSCVAALEDDVGGAGGVEDIAFGSGGRGFTTGLTLSAGGFCWFVDGFTSLLVEGFTSLLESVDFAKRPLFLNRSLAATSCADGALVSFSKDCDVLTFFLTLGLGDFGMRSVLTAELLLEVEATGAVAVKSDLRPISRR